jgi:hypothetical protein
LGPGRSSTTPGIDTSTSSSPRPPQINTHPRYINSTQQPEDDNLGVKPIGLINYLPNGFMSANLGNSRPEYRPTDLTWPYKANQSDTDWAKVGKHIVTYAGPFYISDLQSETEGTVNHGPILAAAIESMAGTTLTRNFTLLEEGKVLLIKIVGRDGYLGLLYLNKIG